MNFEAEVVKVCNDALLELGEYGRVRSLTEGGEHPALSALERACLAKYDDARQMVLRGHKWGFATREQGVACTRDVVGGKFSFARPSRCLMVTDVEGHLAYQVRGDVVYVREPVRTVTYIEDVEDPKRWGRYVRIAIVRRLAADLAGIIQGGSDRTPLLEERYRIAFDDAKRLDAQEGRERDWDGLDPISKAMYDAVPRVGDGDDVWSKGDLWRN